MSGGSPGKAAVWSFRPAPQRRVFRRNGCVVTGVWRRLQADVADTAQASEDLAAALLRYCAGAGGGPQPHGGGRSRAQLARRARASSAAQDVRAPWRAFPERDGGTMPPEAAAELRAALNAAAERAGETEAHVARAIGDMEQVLARHAAQGGEECAACCVSLTRLLHAARSAADRPSEASVKQLVRRPRVCWCSHACVRMRWCGAGGREMWRLGHHRRSMCCGVLRRDSGSPV